MNVLDIREQTWVVKMEAPASIYLEHSSKWVNFYFLQTIINLTVIDVSVQQDG